MGNVRGNAAMTWTDSDDTTTERVLLLREPFREIRPAHAQSVYPADSLDFTQRQVFTVGEGVDELMVRVRYMDDPQGLLDLIKAGSKKRTITYIPDLDDGDRRYACYLISPLSPVGLGLDSDRGTSFGELEVELRLRKTDGTPFADVGKQDRLFSWRAGGRMEEANYSRADVASYAALAGGGGYGTLTTAASGQARTHWMSTASSRGPRTFQTLLLENQRANRVLRSENFASTTWAKSDLTLTSGQSDPRGGTNAFLLDNNSTATQGLMTQIINLTASTRATYSVFIRQGTTAVNEFLGILRSTNDAVTYINGTVTWSSGVPTVTASAGTPVGTRRWRGGWYRASIRTTANLSTGNYKLYGPIPDNAIALKGNVYVFGIQVEQ